jgi:endonuclease VIII
MPEGDTIHRAAQRLNIALGGREIGLAAAPNPRSPLHRRAGELQGLTLEEAEAIGKHLLVHFSRDVVLHTHLGMNGKVFVAADGRMPYGKPWWTLASGRSVASQTGAKLLRLTSESRARNDPSLMQLGPDPLRPGFDFSSTAARLRERAAHREIGDALLDQGIVAGVGNVIRVEGLFRARVGPFRKVSDLSDDELELVIEQTARVMRESMATGRRPRAMYRARRCPGCGGEISSRGQGDDNRIAYWCPACQT